MSIDTPDPIATPYLAIKDFWEHQHYHDGRDITWIKVYAALLLNVKFMGLPEAAQAQLMKLWLIASQTGHPLRYKRRLLAGVIGARGKFHVDALIDAGFLVPCATIAEAHIVAKEVRRKKNSISTLDENLDDSRDDSRTEIENLKSYARSREGEREVDGEVEGEGNGAPSVAAPKTNGHGTNGRRRRSRTQLVFGDVLALIEQREIPGHGIRPILNRARVAELGPHVVRAFDAVGGVKRFLAADGRELGFLAREFSDALEAAWIEFPTKPNHPNTQESPPNAVSHPR